MALPSPIGQTVMFHSQVICVLLVGLAAGTDAADVTRWVLDPGNWVKYPDTTTNGVQWWQKGGRSCDDICTEVMSSESACIEAAFKEVTESFFKGNVMSNVSTNNPTEMCNKGFYERPTDTFAPSTNGHGYGSCFWGVAGTCAATQTDSGNPGWRADFRFCPCKCPNGNCNCPANTYHSGACKK